MELPYFNDDVLYEIILRLPPRPSSLLRASLVCKRWRDIVVPDPQFLRKFGIHHRTPPLLGFFSGHFGKPAFTPALDPPDRIPAELFSMPRQLYESFSIPPRLNERWSLVGCRHGLVLFLHQAPLAMVWDPITGANTCIAIPLEFATADRIICHGAILCAAAADGAHVHCGFRTCPFKVVVIFIDDHYTRAFASVYSSESREWGTVFSTPIPSPVSPRQPSTLVGNALYWMLINNGIIELHLDRQCLAVIENPAGEPLFNDHFGFQIMPSEDGELVLASLARSIIRLWERKTNSCGVPTWEWGETIDLDMILALESGKERVRLAILGFSEDANAILLSMGTDAFLVHLNSKQVRKLAASVSNTAYHPYTSFAIPGSDAKRLIRADKGGDFHLLSTDLFLSGWHYLDPQGDEQGPFSMVELRQWEKSGYFNQDFRVWRAGQTREQAILLTDAMLLLL